jgi:hypothetical protein
MYPVPLGSKTVGATQAPPFWDISRHESVMSSPGAAEAMLGASSALEAARSSVAGRVANTAVLRRGRRATRSFRCMPVIL